jgi:hypothetical protein
MILRILGNTALPIPSYLWRAWLIAFIPTAFISVFVVLVLALPSNKPPAPGTSNELWVFLVVIFSPWVETLLMWPVLALLRRFIPKPALVALASALFWGAVHGMFAVGWGLSVIWVFFVFSTCFLEWEKKSLGKAIFVTGCLHMLHNLTPIIFLFASRLTMRGV